jgi:hypothetical protein
MGVGGIGGWAMEKYADEDERRKRKRMLETHLYIAL